MNNRQITSLAGLIALTLIANPLHMAPAAAANVTPAFGRLAEGGAWRCSGVAEGPSLERLLNNLENLAQEVDLSAQQKTQFERALGQTRTLAATVQSAATMMRQIAEEELGKAQPELETIASASDMLSAQIAAARTAVRAEWLKLYKLLSAQQKAAFNSRFGKGRSGTGWLFLFCS